MLFARRILARGFGKENLNRLITLQHKIEGRKEGLTPSTKSQLKCDEIGRYRAHAHTHNSMSGNVQDLTHNKNLLLARQTMSHAPGASAPLP